MARGLVIRGTRSRSRIGTQVPPLAAEGKDGFTKGCGRLSVSSSSYPKQRQPQQHRTERAAPVVEEERRGTRGAAHGRKCNFLRATRSHLRVVPILVLLGCGESGHGDCCCCSGGCEQGPLLAPFCSPTPCTSTGSCSGTGPLAARNAAAPVAVAAPPPPPPYPAPASPALEVQQPKAASRKQNEPIDVRAALTPAEARGLSCPPLPRLQHQAPIATQLTLPDRLPCTFGGAP